MCVCGGGGGWRQRTAGGGGGSKWGVVSACARRGGGGQRKGSARSRAGMLASQQPYAGERLSHHSSVCASLASEVCFGVNLA